MERRTLAKKTSLKRPSRLINSGSDMAITIEGELAVEDLKTLRTVLLLMAAFLLAYSVIAWKKVEAVNLIVEVNRFLPRSAVTTSFPDDEPFVAKLLDGWAADTRKCKPVGNLELQGLPSSSLAGRVQLSKALLVASAITDLVNKGYCSPAFRIPVKSAVGAVEGTLEIGRLPPGKTLTARLDQLKDHLQLTSSRKMENLKRLLSDREFGSCPGSTALPGIVGRYRIVRPTDFFSFKKGDWEQFSQANELWYLLYSKTELGINDLFTDNLWWVGSDSNRDMIPYPFSAETMMLAGVIHQTIKKGPLVCLDQVVLVSDTSVTVDSYDSEPYPGGYDTRDEFEAAVSDALSNAMLKKFSPAEGLDIRIPLALFGICIALSVLSLCLSSLLRRIVRAKGGARHIRAVFLGEFGPFKRMNGADTVLHLLAERVVKQTLLTAALVSPAVTLALLPYILSYGRGGQMSPMEYFSYWQLLPLSVLLMMILALLGLAAQQAITIFDIRRYRASE